MTSPPEAPRNITIFTGHVGCIHQSYTHDGYQVPRRTGIYLDPVPCSSSKVDRFELHLVWPLVLSSTKDAERVLAEKGSHWESFSTSAPASEIYAEHHFFLPHVREILKPQAQFRRVDVDGIKVNIDGKSIIELALTAVELRVFRPEVAIFSLSANACAQLDLRVVQLLSHRLRRSFAGYWNVDPAKRNVPVSVTFLKDGQEIKMVSVEAPAFLGPHACAPKHPRSDVLPYWEHLLVPLQHDPLNEVLHGFRNPHLEQIPCLRLVALAGGTLDADDYVSVGLAEPLGPHPQGFREEFLAQNSYDRWWTPPTFTTRFFVTGHTFTILADSGGDFLENLSAHIRGQYFQLHILAHLLKSGLAFHRDSLFRAAKNLGAGTAQELANVDKQLDEYLQFVRANRVHEVSGQEQGQELFVRICRAAQLEQLDRETDEMAKMLLSHSDNSHTKRMSQATLRLGVIGAFGMAGGLVCGFWGMNFFGSETPWINRLSGGFALALSIVFSIMSAFVVARNWRRIDRRLSG